MKTLDDKVLEGQFSDYNTFDISDVEEHLNAFYKSYWKEGKEGDKGKLWISCDQLDYLLDKQFGKLVDIKTLQLLESDGVEEIFKTRIKDN